MNPAEALSHHAPLHLVSHERSHVLQNHVELLVQLRWPAVTSLHHYDGPCSGLACPSFYADPLQTRARVQELPLLLLLQPHRQSGAACMTAAVLARE